MKLVSKIDLSKGNPNYFSIMREGDGLVLNNDPYQRTHLTLREDPQQQMEHTEQLPTSSWYIGTHNEQLQRLLESRQPSYKMALTS